ASLTITTQNSTAPPSPVIPRHYQHIRIAELAYAGTPRTSFEDGLLRNSVDLVIPESPTFLGFAQAASPNTPQLLYTNTTTIYGQFLTDWLNFADAQGLPREAAFYHVVRATPFSGSSPSSQPVTWFWAVYRGGTSLTNQTAQARGTASGGV